MKKSSVSVKGSMPAQAVAQVLSELAKCIGDGKVVIGQNQDYVSLTPTDDMDIKIKAGEKKDEERLTMEIKWKKQSDEMVEEVQLTISSEEPEELEEEPAKEEDALAVPAPSEVEVKKDAPVANPTPSEIEVKKDAPVAKKEETPAATKPTKTAAKQKKSEKTKAATK